MYLTFHSITENKCMFTTLFSPFYLFSSQMKAFFLCLSLVLMVNFTTPFPVPEEEAEAPGVRWVVDEDYKTELPRIRHNVNEENTTELLRIRRNVNEENTTELPRVRRYVNDENTTELPRIRRYVNEENTTQSHRRRRDTEGYNTIESRDEEFVIEDLSPETHWGTHGKSTYLF